MSSPAQDPLPIDGGDHRAEEKATTDVYERPIVRPELLALAGYAELPSVEELHGGPVERPTLGDLIQ